MQDADPDMSDLCRRGERAAAAGDWGGVLAAATQARRRAGLLAQAKGGDLPGGAEGRPQPAAAAAVAALPAALLLALSEAHAARGEGERAVEASGAARARAGARALGRALGCTPACR